MNNFLYIKAKNTDQAISELDSDIRHKIIAGGTNINDLLRYFITKAVYLLW